MTSNEASTVSGLIARSNRLGSDPRNTNYAGGNTPAKGTAPAPVTAEPPDLASGSALATAADGERLTAECFGDRVVWVPWRRPGFQLGLDIAALAKASPHAIGCILGGHGITSWGATSEECERRSLEIIRTAEEVLADNGRPEPFRPRLDTLAAPPAGGRPTRAAEPAPIPPRPAPTYPPHGPPFAH